MSVKLVRECFVASIPLVLSMMGSSPLAAQTTEVEVFTIPRPESLVTPVYPQRQANRAEEGLVAISFMVDTDGKVFDPVIVDSTGDEAFHEAALRALRRSEFTPAMLNGEPIIGSSQQMYRFNLFNGANGNFFRPGFLSIYTRFQRAAAEENIADIEEAIQELIEFGPTNHYESAYLSLAHYTHARLSGSEREQLKHIGHALSLSESHEDEQYLEDEMVRDLRRALLSLELRNNFFAEALATFELLQDSGDEEAVAEFEDVIADVIAIRDDDTEYKIPVLLDKNGSFVLDLYKHTFAMLDGEGDLDEVVLRCEKHYVSFPVERDFAYAVPPEWGECSMQILGDSEASFLLQQS